MTVSSDGVKACSLRLKASFGIPDMTKLEAIAIATECANRVRPESTPGKTYEAPVILNHRRKVLVSFEKMRRGLDMVWGPGQICISPHNPLVSHIDLSDIDDRIAQLEDRLRELEHRIGEA